MPTPVPKPEPNLTEADRLKHLMDSPEWRDSRDTLIKHLMRTYVEGYTEALQMGATLICQVISQREDLDSGQKEILRELAGVLVETAAQAPQIWQPPAADVIE